jgi:hypothetical protein
MSSRAASMTFRQVGNNIAMNRENISRATCSNSAYAHYNDFYTISP